MLFGYDEKQVILINKPSKMLADIKKELIDKISLTNDENLLLLLNTDYDYFMQENANDVTDELSEKDKAELINLVNEPFGNETVSQKEFDEAIRKWRTK